MKTQNLDEWYTPESVAVRCVDELNTRLKVPLAQLDAILEPSAGGGAFLRALEVVARHKLVNVCWIDINSKDEQTRRDYLTYSPPMVTTRLVIGNPPFGKKGALATRFFNHAAEHAHVIAFILPLCCASPRQQNKFDLRFHCLHSARLEDVGFEGPTKTRVYQCVWQIWCRHDMTQGLFDVKVEHVPRRLVKELVETPDFEFVSQQQAATAHAAIRKTGNHAGRVLMPTAKCRVLWIRVKQGRDVEAVIQRLKMAKIAQSGTVIGNVSRHDVCMAYNELL